uniref:Glucokinase 1 n=1 Tax=Coptotermes formosanus TaxID=36987 RepID=R4UX31_COPFO|nr:glucokinase 1 [Coptotermes formosanus]
MIDAQMKGKLTSFFEPLWPDKTPKEPIISKTRTMLIDAGTGLGIALIERTPLLKLPYVFATELGHLQTSINMMESPQHDSEFHLTQYISDMMYDGKQAPEFEDIASGRGIPVVYQYYYNQITGKKIPLNEINAEEIASHAKNGDRIAYKTMLTHHQFLMRAAKAVVTSLSCENVLLALDNQVKNDWFVQREKDRLADEFFNFIRPDWMKKIHVYTQRKLQNFTLRGTVWLANTRLNKK